MPSFRLLPWILLGFVAPAGAESAFSLPYPAEFGRIHARALDPEGRPLPLATLSTEIVDGDEVRLAIEAGDPGGARLRASARLAPRAGGTALGLVEQRSTSYTPDGDALRTLLVDHEARRARCIGPAGGVLGEIVLEAQDRVVNVPMTLLFQGLVRGELERLEFEVFVCRGGPRRVAFEAWVEDREDPLGVQVRYGPDLGLASPLLRRFLPRLAFWFDPAAPHGWRGHRLPLYSDGPEVWVLPATTGVAAGQSASD